MTASQPAATERRVDRRPRLRRLRALGRFLSGWLPRTLLWQTFLLVALLFTLVLAVWSQIFRYFEEGPRAKDVAQMVVSERTWPSRVRRAGLTTRAVSGISSVW